MISKIKLIVILFLSISVYAQSNMDLSAKRGDTVINFLLPERKIQVIYSQNSREEITKINVVIHFKGFEEIPPQKLDIKILSADLDVLHLNNLNKIHFFGYESGYYLSFLMNDPVTKLPFRIDYFMNDEGFSFQRIITKVDKQGQPIYLIKNRPARNAK